jgi:hypothetical protein
VRWLLILAPILLGLMGGAAARLVDDARPSAEGEPVEWALGELDPKVLEETADIDAILALKPPKPGDPVEHWMAFGRAVNAVDTGSRYSKSGQTTPMLGWYAYLAKHHPEAVYRLYNEGVVTGDHLGHLFEVGLAPGWDEYVQDVDKLLLSERAALANLAVAKGVEYAQRRVIDAFFARSDLRIQLQLESLRFALPAMTDDEVERFIPHLRNSLYRPDPRRFRGMLQSDRFAGREGELLSLIVEYAYSSRSMSSYLVDGALLGNSHYVHELLSDLSDNAKQPTNFYCAACGLALATDGVIGSALLQAIGNGQPLAVSHDGVQIVITPSTTQAGRMP